MIPHLTPEQLTKITARIFKLTMQEEYRTDDYDLLDDRDKVFMKLLAFEINKYFEGK